MQVKITVIRGTWAPFACGTGSTLPDDVSIVHLRGSGRLRSSAASTLRRTARSDGGRRSGSSSSTSVRNSCSRSFWVRHISQASVHAVHAHGVRLRGIGHRIEAEIQKVDPQRLRLRLPVGKREQQPPASRVRAVERRGDQFVGAVAEHGVPCRGEVAQRPRSPVGERLLAGGKQSVECLHFVGRTYGGGDARRTADGCVNPATVRHAAPRRFGSYRSTGS